MSFKKTGEAPIIGVFCKCGYELNSKDAKCPNCEKDLKKCDSCCGNCEKEKSEE